MKKKSLFLILPLLISGLLSAQTFIYAGNANVSRTREGTNTLSLNTYVDQAVAGTVAVPSSNNRSLQLITHGRPGQLFIEGRWMGKNEIAVWIKNHYPATQFDQLNIYGCEFGKGETGAAAITYLKEHLYMQVAASTNITGKDGDWILETGKSTTTISMPGYPYNLQCTAAPTTTLAANTSCISNNGSITVTNVLTPASDYEFSKDGGITWQAGNFFNNLPAGVYNVRYRNVPGNCLSPVLQSTVTTSITAPTTPAGTATASNCNASTGQISLNTYTSNNNFEFSINGGTTWTTGSGTNPGGVVFTGLAPGVYNIIARSLNTGCLSANSANVTVGSATTPTTPAGTATAATSCGSPNGQVSLNTYASNNNFEFSINGGTSWITGSGTNPGGVVFTGLAPGIYNIIARNLSTGCLSANSANITVGQPAVTTPAGTATASNCNASTGQISLNTYTSNNNFEFSINGGTTWITGSGTNPGGVVFTGLAPGIYNIIARSLSTGCLSANSANITVGSATAPTTPAGTATAATSCSSPNGQISLNTYTSNNNFEFSINGGTSWTTGSGTNPGGVLFTGLAPGIYNIIARSLSTGCLSANSANITVGQPAVTTPAGTATASNCNASTGQVSLNTYTSNNNFEFSINGGTSWTTGSGTNPGGVVFTGLAPGIYNIIARSLITGCSSASSANVTVSTVASPAAPSNTLVANSNCTTVPNGSITVATGSYTPIGNFQFSRDNGITWQAGNVFSNLAQGNYNIAVRNTVTGCVSATTISNILNTTTAAAAPTASVTTVLSNCTTPTAVITVTAPTPLANYEFSKDSGLTWQPGNVFSGLGAGVYQIKSRLVSSGCESATATSVTVTTPVVTAPTASVTTALSNCTAPNGVITVTAPTPLANHEFSKDNGLTWQPGNIFSGLAAGVYPIRSRLVSSGCVSATATNITVTAPVVTAPTASVTTALSNCTTPNAVITVTAPTPLANYEFSKDNGLTWQPGNIFSGLGAGVYPIRSRLISSGCVSATATNVTVTAPVVTAPTASVTTALSNCITPNGVITVTAPTPLANYEFSKDNGLTWQPGNTFSSLGAGVYPIRSRLISSGCVSATATNVTVTVPAVTAPTVVAQNSTSCLTDNGTITATAPTPLSNFQFSKDDGLSWQSSPYFTGVAPGTYSIKAKLVSSGCVSAATASTITAPAAVTAPVLTVTNVTNCNTPNGSIVFTPPADTYNYSFSIDSGVAFSSNPSFTGLADGTYYATIKNNNTGCSSAITATQTKTLTNGTPAIVATSVNATSCFPNGSITVTTPALASGYTYSKDGGATWQTDNVFSNLDAGTYNIIAKNTATGCLTAVSQKVITNAGAIDPPLAIIKPRTCAALGSVEFISPSPLTYYEFSIDSGISFQSSALFTNLAAGAYRLVVRSNSSNCTSQPQVIIVEDTRNAISCGDLDGDGVLNENDMDSDNDGITDIVEKGSCTSLLDGFVDGSFEAAAAVAWNENTNTGSLNSTMGASGWGSYAGSPDTWTGAFSLLGSGFWGGANNGVPATPDGNIYASVYNGFINEAISTTIPAAAGMQVGHTYALEYYQVFGGTNGFTLPGQQAQFRFTIAGTPYLGTMMTYNGNNPKLWQKDRITFVATTTTPLLIIDILAAATGTEANYLSIDGIKLYDLTNPCTTYLDTDNDGVPNYLDLDSDGDGCPDAVEAGVYKTSVGPAMKNGTIQNGNNTGTVTTTQTVTNAAVAGPYGANGLANSIETSSESNLYYSTYTYGLATDGVTSANCSAIIILPLRWLNVSAALTANAVKIDWLAGAEEHTSYYEIFRSVSGTNFMSIGRVMARSNNATPNNYVYTDYDALFLSSARLYYYIRAVNVNGSAGNSGIVQVQTNRQSPKIVVYPNPSQGEIHFSSLANTRSINIYNVNGEVVKQFQQVTPAHLTYDLSGIVNGYYIIRLISNSGESIWIPFNLVK